MLFNPGASVTTWSDVLTHRASSFVSALSYGRTQITLALAVLVGAFLLGFEEVPGLGIGIEARVVLPMLLAPFVLYHTVHRIEYGILALPVVAAVVPLSIGTGTGSPLVASLLFAIFLLGLWAIKMLTSPRVRLLSSPINAPLIGFLATALLATLASNVTADPLFVQWPNWTQIQIGGVSVFIVSVGLLLLTASVLRSVYWVERLVWVFLGVGAAALLLERAPLGGSFNINTGGLFSMWVIVLALGQAMFNRKLSGTLRLATAGLGLGWLGLRTFAQGEWLSGWVPALAAILVMTFFRSRRLFFVALVAVLAIGTLNQEHLFSTQVTGAESEGNLLRLDLWERSLALTSQHLPLGSGVAGYARYYVSFNPTQAWSTHSNYLDILAETGLIGASLFLWFLVAMFRMAGQVRSRWPDGFAAGYAHGVLGGLTGATVAMALGDWVIPFVYNQTIAGFRYTMYTWLFLGALGSMWQLTQTRARYD
jgi:hypothetical protein